MSGREKTIKTQEIAENIAKFSNRNLQGFLVCDGKNLKKFPEFVITPTYDLENLFITLLGSCHTRPNNLLQHSKQQHLWIS